MEFYSIQRSPVISAHFSIFHRIALKHALNANRFQKESARVVTAALRSIFVPDFVAIVPNRGSKAVRLYPYRKRHATPCSSTLRRFVLRSTLTPFFRLRSSRIHSTLMIVIFMSSLPVCVCVKYSIYHLNSSKNAMKNKFDAHKICTRNGETVLRPLPPSAAVYPPQSPQQRERDPKTHHKMGR